MQPWIDGSARPWNCATFSILGRIGGDATGAPPGRTALAGVRFQYPRSDRRRCNQNQDQNPQKIWQPFSILGRIGGDATTSRTSIRAGLKHFQYPRSDRRRCNVSTAHVLRLLLDAFQYPRSDRRRCNAGQAAQGLAGRRLSVSSVGSEAMQLARKRCRAVIFFIPFSILGRIGGDATGGGDCWALGGGSLSVSSVGSEAMQPAGH